MASSLNKNLLGGDAIVSVISSDKFGDYDSEMQQEILSQIEKSNLRDGGFVGKFFGNKKELTSMNIAATICILLIIICGIDVIHTIFSESELHMDLISAIIPVVSLSLGFIFGKSSGKSE